MIVAVVPDVERRVPVEIREVVCMNSARKDNAERAGRCSSAQSETERNEALSVIIEQVMSRVWVGRAQ